MKRDSNGKFAPAVLKVGAKVINLRSGFNPGFKHMRVYTVVATCRSNLDELHKKLQPHFRYDLERHPMKETDFYVYDDDKVLRRCSLVQNHLGWWEVYNDAQAKKAKI